MNNIKRIDKKVTEEEIEKIKSLDWASYYKNYSIEDSDKIHECPKCKVMIFPQKGDTEFTCKKCGEKIIL